MIATSVHSTKKEQYRHDTALFFYAQKALSVRHFQQYECRYRRIASSALPVTPQQSFMPQRRNAFCAAEPMPSQINVSTLCWVRNTANAPWLLPTVDTISVLRILLSSVTYSLKLAACPKFWNILPFSYGTAIIMKIPPMFLYLSIIAQNVMNCKQKFEKPCILLVFLLQRATPPASSSDGVTQYCAFLGITGIFFCLKYITAFTDGMQ